MNLTLAIRGRKDRFLVDVLPFSIRLKEGLFCINTPMHDDWLQTQDFDLGKVDALVEGSLSEWKLSFPNEDDLKQFQLWLKEANARAQQGYRTMWP
jgi:hypothetical protein